MIVTQQHHLDDYRSWCLTCITRCLLRFLFTRRHGSYTPSSVLGGDLETKIYHKPELTDEAVG